jgi:hypothetical protein
VVGQHDRHAVGEAGIDAAETLQPGKVEDEIAAGEVVGRVRAEV